MGHTGDRTLPSDAATWLFAEVGQPEGGLRPSRRQGGKRTAQQHAVRTDYGEEGQRGQVAVQGTQLIRTLRPGRYHAGHFRSDHGDSANLGDDAGQIVHRQLRVPQRCIAGPRLTIRMLSGQGEKLRGQDRHEATENQQHKAGGKLH